MNQETKNCSACHENKPLDEFYKDKRTADGCYSSCKKCHQKMHKHETEGLYAKYYKNKEKWLLYHKNYWSSYRIKTEEIRQKIKSRDRVGKRVITGKLTKQCCEICGEKIVEAHHPDYAKPLEVIWLCKKHHIEEHMRLKAT